MFAVIKAVALKLVLIASSLAITLLLLEFAIRAFYPQPINYYNFTLIQAEGGGEMVVGSDIATEGKKQKGYGPYIPNLSTQFGGVTITTNSRGWRDSEYSLEKPEGVTRIMVVGDSVVFGYGVELEEMFPRVLERELNGQGTGRYQVLSMGGAGANTYYQRNSLRENVPIYTPDLVILAFNLNDILPQIFGRKNVPLTDARRSISWAVLRLRQTLDAAFRSRSHLYFLFREKMKSILRRFGIASPTMVRLAAFDMESDHGIAAWRDTRQVLLEIAAQLRKERIPLLLAILPVEMQLSPQIADIYRHEYGFIFADSLVNGKPQEVIKDFAEQHGIAWVDLLPAFRSAPGEKKFFRIHGQSVDWNHPNPLGHRIIADELRKRLSTSLASLSNSNDSSVLGTFRRVNQVAP